MEPLTLMVLGGAGYYLYKKRENPAWSPLSWLLSSPFDKHVALEAVKVTSVPTPGPAVALDPNMTTDQVKQVNDALMTETDAQKIAAQAKALSDLGHESSANALHAKAAAIHEAKALGADDVEINKKQIEASAAAPSAADARVGWDGGWGGYGGWGGGYGWPHHHHHRDWGYGGYGGYGWPYGGYGGYGGYGAYNPYGTGTEWVGDFDLFAHGVPAQPTTSRPGWGAQPQHPAGWGRPADHRGYGHPAWGGRGYHEPWGAPRPGARRHRRRFVPPMMAPPPQEEVVVVEEDQDQDMDMMMPEPMQVPEPAPMPAAPPPPMPPPPRPQPAGQITHGYVTDGDFDLVGVIPYSGGGLVAEFPGVPQMAGPSMQMAPQGGFEPGDVESYYAQPDYVPVPVPVPDYGDYDMGADWGYQQPVYPQYAPPVYARVPRRVPRRRWRRW